MGAGESPPLFEHQDLTGVFFLGESGPKTPLALCVRGCLTRLDTKSGKVQRVEGNSEATVFPGIPASLSIRPFAPQFYPAGEISPVKLPQGAPP